MSQVETGVLWSYDQEELRHRDGRHVCPLFVLLLGAFGPDIEHGDQQAQQPPLSEDLLQVLAPGPGSHGHPLSNLVAGLPPENQQQLVAAETRAGQADGKPEVEHEDDEHVRTEDSSCGGGRETPDRFTPRPRPQALLLALALSAARQFAICSKMQPVRLWLSSSPQVFLSADGS